MVQMMQCMKSNVLPVLIAGLLLAGCATPPEKEIYTYRADFGGPDMDLIMDNELVSEEDKTSILWLNASRIRDSAWDSRYYLEANYQTLRQIGWLDVRPGQSLIIHVDGEEIRLTGQGSVNTRRETGDGIIVENAIYSVTPDQLRTIAKGRDVKVTLNGYERSIEREFQPENTERFRNFVLTYMGF